MFVTNWGNLYSVKTLKIILSTHNIRESQRTDGNTYLSQHLTFEASFAGKYFLLNGESCDLCCDSSDEKLILNQSWFRIASLLSSRDSVSRYCQQWREFEYCEHNSETRVGLNFVTIHNKILKLNFQFFT